MMRALKIAALLFGFSATAQATTSIPIYDGVVTSTPTGKATRYLQGVMKVGVSTPTALAPQTTYTIVLDGPTGGVNVSSVTARYGIKAATFTATAVPGFSGDGSGLTGIPGTALADGSVVTAKIATDAVTSDKLISGSVTTAKMATDAVASASILGGAITTGKMASAAVTTGSIAADAITSEKILTNGVTTAKIASGSITTAKLAVDAVAATNILGSAVTTNKVANDAVTGRAIRPDAIVAGTNISLTRDASGNTTINNTAASQTITITTSAIANISTTQTTFNVCQATVAFVTNGGPITFDLNGVLVLASNETGGISLLLDGQYINGYTNAIGPIVANFASAAHSFPFNLHLVPKPTPSAALHNVCIQLKDVGGATITLESSAANLPIMNIREN